MAEMTFEEMVEQYNRINNSFKHKCIYHVGIDAGFHSEVDAMMECMIYCYINKIKFVLYADDSNFAGGRNAYEEFFRPFCEMSHNRLNHTANYRYSIFYGYKYMIKNRLLRLIERADYLTADVFKACIPREYACNTDVKWEMFGISGTVFDEYGKLGRMALRYNDKTQTEVEKVISSLGLPDSFISVQFRGGDKLLEYTKLNSVDSIMDIVTKNDKGIKDLFILSDDYAYVREVKIKYPKYRVFTLTREDEHGYDNSEFNSLDWTLKREKMIKLFAAIDLCIASDIHFGNGQTCLNNYVRSVKDPDKYVCAIDGKENER